MTGMEAAAIALLNMDILQTCTWTADATRCGFIMVQEN
jgi:hypothetical protein